MTAEQPQMPAAMLEPIVTLLAAFGLAVFADHDTTEGEQALSRLFSAMPANTAEQVSAHLRERDRQHVANLSRLANNLKDV